MKKIVNRIIFPLSWLAKKTTKTDKNIVSDFDKIPSEKKIKVIEFFETLFVFISIIYFWALIEEYMSDNAIIKAILFVVYISSIVTFNALRQVERRRWMTLSEVSAQTGISGRDFKTKFSIEMESADEIKENSVDLDYLGKVDTEDETRTEKSK